MMAVRTESGSSMTLMLRDNVSMMIMKLAPRLILTGITNRLLLPVSILAQCGIRSPIQPTCPHMDTLEAVITVAARINASLVFFKSIPLALASSSLRERMFNFQRRR